MTQHLMGFSVVPFGLSVSAVAAMPAVEGNCDSLMPCVVSFLPGWGHSLGSSLLPAPSIIAVIYARNN